MKELIQKIIDCWFEIGITVALSLMLFLIFATFYSESKSEKIEISKNDWDCTRSEINTRIQPMIVGKTTIMTPVTDSYCVEYKRK